MLSPAQERTYKKLKNEIIGEVKSLRLNQACIDALVEQLYDISIRSLWKGRGAVFESSGMRLSLVSRFPLARQGTGVATEFLLHPGEPSTFILRQVEGDGGSGLEARLVGIELLTRTLGFWRRWLSKCRYHGRWREMVNRSVLVLKMLTFAPTGATVAAPTCSLPEEIRGARNWDTATPGSVTQRLLCTPSCVYRRRRCHARGRRSASAEGPSAR